MKRRSLVLITLFSGIIGFAAAGYFFTSIRGDVETASSENPSVLVRPYSPIIGRHDAPVTIVEFFDPACEACRAFYPYLKQILSRYPSDVRLVLRYAPLHQGSEEAVRIIEAARLQDKFEQVLTAVLAAQPEWADHKNPDLRIAWSAAASAGLDLDAAKKVWMSPEITSRITQDVADLKTVKISGTPTFYIDGKLLKELGLQQLVNAVDGAVRAKQQP